jgi:ribonuclease-3
MAAPWLDSVERALGHVFRDERLVERALTHSSAAGGPTGGNAVEDNEQLEYLGDALIGFLVAEYLITSFPDWDEGRLSKSRARLVSGSSLAAAARRLQLGGHLRLGRGEEKTGGREKPALLANVFEAVTSAIYLDAGLETARAFVGKILLEDAVKSEGSHLGLSDHKSALQELLQSRGLPPAVYQVVREAGPDHQKTFWVEVSVSGKPGATGVGTTKKEAEQAAAELALAGLREQADIRTEKRNV